MCVWDQPTHTTLNIVTAHMHTLVDMHDTKEHSNSERKRVVVLGRVKDGKDDR